MESRLVIQQKIKALGLKQNHVALKAGVDPQKLSRYLTNRQKMPMDEFLAICRVLALTLNDFGECDVFSKPEVRDDA